MSSHCNPSVVDDGLVFLYDVEDIQSYKGEPTENLAGSIVKKFTNWNGLTGTTEYYTTSSGDQGVKLVTTASGGVQWYSFSTIYNIQASTQYTISATVKYTGGTPHPNLLYVRQYDGNGQTSESGKFTTANVRDLGGGWKRIWRTFTTDSTTTHINLQGYEYTTGKTIYIQDLQFELKSHATQFAGVSTTRSSTQGLLDRTGNETINLSDVSFNSNSEMIFDGTDDFIPLVDNPQNGENSVSWEFITKFDLVHDNETSTYRQLYIQESSVWIGQYYDYIGIDIAKDNGSWFDGNGGRVTSSKIGPVNSGEYYHVVFTWDGTNVKGYLNSELGFTTAISGLTGIRNGVTPRRIGRRSGNPLIGEMPIVKLYNRALTATEVLQNFNATKSRFGL